MKKTITFLAITLMLIGFLESCSRSVTMQQAASGSYRHSRTVR